MYFNDVMFFYVCSDVLFRIMSKTKVECTWTRLNPWQMKSRHSAEYSKKTERFRHVEFSAVARQMHQYMSLIFIRETNCHVFGSLVIKFGCVLLKIHFILGEYCGT